MEKKNNWTWHSPTTATLIIGKQEVGITISRPMDTRDLPWLYRGIFEYEQLMRKGLTSNANTNDRAA